MSGDSFRSTPAPLAFLGSMLARSAVPDAPASLPNVQDTTFRPRPAFTDRDQVDLCIGGHPCREASILS
ncbi:MAG TPA: hypothetical protein VE871_14575, partial [Longimicrobium sp.]|nr:hypothetical protein [Longimicrobium sp.]